MADGKSSGLAHGTSGAKQLSLEQTELMEIAKENELTLEQERYNGFQSSPITTSGTSNNADVFGDLETQNEIILSLVEKPEINLHIYEGYFNKIFGLPLLESKEWNGFTRDYNKKERVFGGNNHIITDIKEYLDDMLIYSDKDFKDEKVDECYHRLYNFLKFAMENTCRILVHIQIRNTN